MAKLKVYRTPIGFHDAYVAVPSQKAALAVWGADANLFARGVAELVTDPKLMAEPLARPGEVIRKVRGSAAEHLNALGKMASRATKPARSPLDALADPRQLVSKHDEPPPQTAKPRRSKPRPSRISLERADKALADLERDLADQLKDIATRKRALEQEQQQAKTRGDELRRQLEAKRDKARADFSARLEAWAREEGK